MNATLLGIFIGALITWYVSDRYYKKASVDLDREASELKRLNSLLLDGMEHQGWITINRDPDGSIKGFEKNISAPGFDSFESGSHGIGHG